MAELADAPDLGSGVFDVQVQVLLSAVKKKAKVIKTFVFFLGRIASWNLSVQGLRSAPVGARPRSPGPRAPCYPQTTLHLPVQGLRSSRRIVPLRSCSLLSEVSRICTIIDGEHKFENDKWSA